MPDNPSAPTTGQAPESERPQAGQQVSSPASESPQAGATTTPSNPSANTRTSDDYERQIAELRKENASYRTKQNAIEKAQADADAAKLSDLEKANKRAADAEAQLNDRTRAYQERLVKAEIKAGAAGVGIIDPDAAVKLLDWSQFEYDDEGVPTNISKLLDQLVKDKPYLAGARASGAVSSGGVTNPSRSATSAAGSAITWDAIGRMSRNEYLARQAEIQEYIARNPPKR